MNWYHAADGQQSGPFTHEEFRALIADRTVQPATLVWEARLPNWIPLAQVPPEMLPPAPSGAAYSAAPPIPIATAAPGQVLCAECGKSFPPDEVIRLADRNVCAACKPILVQRLSEGAAPASVDGLWVNEADILQREYRVEIGSCLERAWKAITSNLGPVIVSGLLFVLLMGGVGLVFGGLMAIGFSFTGLMPGGGGGGLPSVPVIIGLVIAFLVVVIAFLIGSTLITAGYSWFYLNLVRHGQANYGMIFEGFRRQVRSLLGALLIQTLISVAVSAPFSIAVQFMAMAKGPAAITMLATGVLQLISAAISIYLWAIWFFTTLLILDKRMRAWPAMQLSRKLVSKRIWMTLLFILVAAILTLAGFLACVIGLFVSVPLFLAMKAVLYDDNFRDLQPTQTN